MPRKLPSTTHLRQRFGEMPGLRYYHSDGKTLPVLAPASLDYIIAFDVFVHFEPRLVYWYVQQIARLLKPGGIGILHYANMLTPLGWHFCEMWNRIFRHASILPRLA